MAEPTHGLEFIEWVKLVGTTILTAVGSVWGWWRSVKRAFYARIAKLEGAMNAAVDELRETTQRHETEIAVLKTHQQNSQQQLHAIASDTKDIRTKVDRLVEIMLNRN